MITDIRIDITKIGWYEDGVRLRVEVLTDGNVHVGRNELIPYETLQFAPLFDYIWARFGQELKEYLQKNEQDKI